jgi:hypothetical protein
MKFNTGPTYRGPCCTNGGSKMPDKNYYEILGTAPSASKKTLKEQFRKMMKLYHPDVNSSQSAVTRYAEIMEAYRTLSDKSARAMYDLANNFEGAASVSSESSSRPSAASSASHSETLESRKEHYEKLLREKRAREQMRMDTSFSPHTYIARWRVLLVIPASSFAIAALSIALGKIANISTGDVDFFAVTAAAFALALLLWLVYLIFRLSAAYLGYQPPTAILWLWGLPSSFLYDAVLGRSYGGAGYGGEYFMTVGNIFLPGLLVFFLIFACGLSFLEAMPQVRQMQRQKTDNAAI